jgi:hypothetical protein
VSTEPTSVLEHVASAMNGRDSRDWLGALAMAQVQPGAVPPELRKALGGVVPNTRQREISSLGAQLTRLQTEGTQLTYNQARESIAGLVRRLNQVRRWKLSDKHIARVAESSLLLHLHPTCRCCHGRKYEVIEATPSLSKIECPACHGTGNQPMPRRNGSEVAAVLNVLGLIQGLTERAVQRRYK